MSIYTTTYLPIQSYLTKVASNPKLNLSDEQKKNFQEVLTETTQALAKEATKTYASSIQTNDIWKSIGAAGMYSSGFSDLLLSGIYGSSFSNSMNPLATGILPSTLNQSNYLSNLYYPSNKSYGHTNLTHFYENLSRIQNKL